MLTDVTDEWPMLRHDPQLTGRSTKDEDKSYLTAYQPDGSVKWQATVPDAVNVRLDSWTAGQLRSQESLHVAAAFEMPFSKNVLALFDGKDGSLQVMSPLS